MDQDEFVRELRPINSGGQSGMVRPRLENEMKWNVAVSTSQIDRRIENPQEKFGYPNKISYSSERPHLSWFYVFTLYVSLD